ncbi:MAG: hypothetical protein PHY46_01200 [Candidatus Omnitrophica bacterium]|nr:hypothetical protein [Candidatus Omnitrophota bacterium]
MKTKMFKSLVLWAVVILISGCNIMGWKQYASVEGGFSVQLPGEPEGQKIILDTQVGRTYLNMYTLNRKDDNFIYAVGYVDYPDELFNLKSVDQILNDGRDGAARNVQGVLTKESNISIEGYPGREFTIEVGNGEAVVKGKLFLVGQRVYQLMVTTDKKWSDSYNIKRFLDSFQLIKSKTR